MAWVKDEHNIWHMKPFRTWGVPPITGEIKKMKEVTLDSQHPTTPKMKVEETKMYMQRKAFDHIVNKGPTPYAQAGLFMFPESAITDPREWVEVKVVACEKDKPKDESGNPN